MILLEDKNQKRDAHIKKHNYWKRVGVEVIQKYRLPVGDYVLMNEKIEDVIARKEKRGMDVKMMDLLGTYKRVVDTKNSMAEIEMDLNGKQYERFRDSLILAQNNGIEFYILIEDDGGYVDRRQTIYNKPCRSIEDVFSWKNPRLFIVSGGKQKYPRAKKGQQLAKQMLTIEKEYGCHFVFCGSYESGKTVLTILGD